MKSLSIFLSLVTLGLTVNGQTLQTVTSNGAITTNTITVASVIAEAPSLSGASLPINISSLSGLRINGNVANSSHNGITYQSGGGGGAAIGFYRGGSYDTGLDFYTNSIGYQTISHRMRITSNGDVGIGTTSPVQKLDVAGSIAWNGFNTGNPRGLKIGYSGGNYGAIGYNIDFTSSTGVFNRPLNDQSSYLEFAFGGFKFFGTGNTVSSNGVTLNGGGTNLNLFAVITSAGDFGIGTATPAEKLSVNGKIRAHEIKVEAANWPDFVFAKDYNLPTLQETEKHIKEKGHLPGIPSAAEVEKNGIELGDMNKKLLQKIEELTLYLIEQSKEISELKKEVYKSKKD